MRFSKAVHNDKGDLNLGCIAPLFLEVGLVKLCHKFNRGVAVVFILAVHAQLLLYLDVKLFSIDGITEIMSVSV